MELIVKNTVNLLQLIVNEGNSMELVLKAEPQLVLELNPCVSGGGSSSESSNTVVSGIAGEIINGDSLVMIKDGLVYKYNPSDITNIYKCAGFAKNAVVEGETVKITINGLHESPGWGLTQNEVYWAGSNGLITTTPPDSGILQVVGMAKDSNALLVEISEPILM